MKIKRLGMLAMLFSLLIPSASAVLSGLSNLGGFYLTYWQFVDAVLFTLIFMSLAQFVFKGHHKAMSIGIGIALGISLLMFEITSGIRILLTPYVAVVILIIGWFFIWQFMNTTLKDISGQSHPWTTGITSLLLMLIVLESVLSATNFVLPPILHTFYSLLEPLLSLLVIGLFIAGIILIMQGIAGVTGMSGGQGVGGNWNPFNWIPRPGQAAAPTQQAAAQQAPQQSQNSNQAPNNPAPPGSSQNPGRLQRAWNRLTGGPAPANRVRQLSQLQDQQRRDMSDVENLIRQLRTDIASLITRLGPFNTAINKLFTPNTFDGVRNYMTTTILPILNNYRTAAVSGSFMPIIHGSGSDPAIGNLITGLTTAHTQTSSSLGTLYTDAEAITADIMHINANLQRGLQTISRLRSDHQSINNAVTDIQNRLSGLPDDVRTSAAANITNLVNQERDIARNLSAIDTTYTEMVRLFLELATHFNAFDRGSNRTPFNAYLERLTRFIAKLSDVNSQATTGGPNVVAEIDAAIKLSSGFDTSLNAMERRLRDFLSSITAIGPAHYDARLQSIETSLATSQPLLDLFQSERMALERQIQASENHPATSLHADEINEIRNQGRTSIDSATALIASHPPQWQNSMIALMGDISRLLTRANLKPATFTGVSAQIQSVVDISTENIHKPVANHITQIRTTLGTLRRDWNRVVTATNTR